MTIQEEIDRAIADRSATFEISEGNRKLILSVAEGNELIAALDKAFGSSKRSLIPSAQMSGDDAIPPMKIGGYSISPSVFQPEKHVKNGYHIYKFDYVR